MEAAAGLFCRICSGQLAATRPTEAACSSSAPPPLRRRVAARSPMSGVSSPATEGRETVIPYPRAAQFERRRPTRRRQARPSHVGHSGVEPWGLHGGWAISLGVRASVGRAAANRVRLARSIRFARWGANG
jgi:hypothetical protein